MSAPAVPFRHVAIAGLGLMGGSLARALRALPHSPRVSGAARDRATVDRALGDGVIEAAFALAEPPADADLLVYATPVTVTIELLRSARTFPEGMVISDVGSVKAPLLRVAADLSITRFVGAHPVAGDHRSGYGAARADLYAGAQVWITPWEHAAPVQNAMTADHNAVAGLWTALGARAAFTAADAHDALMAWVSHVPQITASALTAALAQSGHDASQLGPGGRDTTRLGQSSGALWADILLHNAEHIAAPLQQVRAALEDLAAAIERRDAAAIESLMTEAAGWRSTQ